MIKYVKNEMGLRREVFVPKFGLKFCYVVNIISFIVTILFWFFVLFKLYINPNDKNSISQDALASTFGFLISDLTIAVVVLAIAIVGLRTMKFWGWFAAQLANILWIYSIVNLLARDFYTGTFAPGLFIFIPIALFSIWALIYLWKTRKLFKDE